ncbi:GtrA family protein [Methylocystis echinoides]|jgi:putative flippase GtrA|uniref:GtrA family protein n=1 Tax=Methylocystis echinoides TaxID=29468 RepID=UPI0034405859
MVLFRQLTTYASVGAAATAVHYAILVGLVEAGGWRPVPATLCGYVAGGVVAYLLNRRHTFGSDRPHAEAGWRFALTAFIGFCITYALMSLFVERLGAPYLPAQIVTTVLAMFVTFAINRSWTFGVG